MASLSHLLGSPTSIAFLILSFFQASVAGITFTFTNKCTDTVWPGILSGSGTPPLETTGFALSPGQSRSLYAPQGWSGRFWARSGCDFDSSGKGSCATGDCGSGEVECHGAGASPPATLAEFTLDGAGGKDFYDVSLVDGYNLPMLVQAAVPDCPDTGCLVDLNERCPEELRAEDGRACRSACEAFGSPEYCCNGAYGNPDTCHPSQYSQLFKSACPKSYSYAYDDATSTFTCNHTDYTITFCPKSTPSGGNSNKKLRRPSHEQLEDDVWLASLKKTSSAGSPTTASWSASTAFQSALAIAVVIMLAVFDHPLLSLL
ncbi:hypothetical protein QOZ80_8BG0668520 [Eleusine coracana subsp. coracana]|nr:hypothetical protein QOZ80_8BG0668520 [Eleusine coracana subsp. coracana]